MIKNRLLAASVLAAIIVPTTAMATNGYFMMGNGTKANGRAGVGIAMHDSAISGADNPAAMVRVGNRFDFGVQIFDPNRKATITGNGGFNTLNGPTGSLDYKDTGNNDGPFYIPEGGFNYMLSDDMSVGLTVVGTGGMNTNYRNLGIFNAGAAFGQQTTTGINLEQVRILPTLSYKINNQHSVGISLQIAYQQFMAWGLDNFTASGGPSAGQVSLAPNRLSGKGRDDSWGFGVSVGWQGTFMDDRLTLGLVYNSEINMDKMGQYKGLFAEKGNLDIPENYGVGIAFKATDQLLLAFDVQQINFSDVRSIGNKLQGGNGGFDLFSPDNYLGRKHGSGFGWDDMTVYKLGAEYQWNKALTLRAGYSHADQPISKSQTFFNILAPATIEDHATIGMTYTLPNESQVSMFYMHAFQEKVNGRNSIPAAFGGGEADIKMHQDAWGIAYGWNF